MDWAAKGYEVDVITRNPNYPKGKIYGGYQNKIITKYSFENINIRGIWFHPKIQERLFYKILSALSYVLLSTLLVIFRRRKYKFLFFYQTGPIFNGFCARFVSAKQKIIWVQDFWPSNIALLSDNKLIGSVSHFFSGLIYSFFDKFLCSSEGYISELKNLYNINDSLLNFAPNWSEVQLKSNEPDYKNAAKKNILYAGNIGKWQDLEAICEAIKYLNNSKIVLNIVGDGSIKEKLIRSYDSCEAINFYPYCSSNDLISHVNMADYFLISLKDTKHFRVVMPSKFQFYLYHRRPIICLVKGYLSDLIENKNIGIACKSRTRIGLTNFFRELFLVTDKEYFEMVKNCKQERNEYDKSRVIQLINSLM